MQRLLLVVGLVCGNAFRLLGQDHFLYPGPPTSSISVSDTLLLLPEFSSVLDTLPMESPSTVKGLADFIQSQPNDSIMHALGKQNARLYFKRRAVFNAAAIGTTLGIATAGITLAVPIALAAIPAKVKEKDIPDLYLMQNSSYMAGYTAEAKRRKRMTVLKGTGVGVLGAGVVVGTLYLILRSVSHY